MLSSFFPPVVPVVSARVMPSGAVVEGSTVELVCEAVAGDQPISFNWTAPDGQPASPTDTDGTISITPTAASGGYGAYNCTATNQLGEDSVLVDVIQAGMCIGLDLMSLHNSVLVKWHQVLR